MNIADQITAKAEEGARDLGAELFPRALAEACAQVLDVSGTGLSLLSGPERVPLGASNEDAATAERLQFTVGDGPCFSAYESGRTVYAGPEELAAKWPAFYNDLLARTVVRAVVSVPMIGQTVLLGVLDVYFDHAEDMIRPSDARAPGLITAARAAAALLERETARHVNDLAEWAGGPGAVGRHEVWVAVGMLMAAFGLDSKNALTVMRGYSYSTGTTVENTARGLSEHTISVRDLHDGTMR